MATETRGRKRTYSTPEDMRAAIIQYFDECSKAKILPDYPGMVIFLKFRSKQALEKYADPERYMKECNGDEEAARKKADAYAEVLEEAQLRRESYLARVMASDNKRAQGCLNLLKQKENGGYTDKQPESNEKTLNIRVVGVGGWDAFK
jgi:hypothetical protein